MNWLFRSCSGCGTGCTEQDHTTPEADLAGRTGGARNKSRHRPRQYQRAGTRVTWHERQAV